MQRAPLVGSISGQKYFVLSSNQVETNSFEFFPIPSPTSYCSTAITRGTWQGALLMFQAYPVISLSCLNTVLENAPFLRNLCATTGIKLPPTLDCNAICHSLFYAVNLHLKEPTTAQLATLALLHIIWRKHQGFGQSTLPRLKYPVAKIWFLSLFDETQRT